MLNNQELTAVLRQNGYKVTPQRLAVYEALANTKQHPSAEMLFGTLQPKYPSMSFATVYKTVEILNRLGLIQIHQYRRRQLPLRRRYQRAQPCAVHCLWPRRRRTGYQ